ncbi:hypothetical protein REPUB_Repub01dG0143600 [Reevesia pubescens]
MKQWTDFCNTLNDYHPCKNLLDALIWKNNTTGIYTSKSFCYSTLKATSILYENWKKFG